MQTPVSVPRHLAQQTQVETADYHKHLTTNFQFFQTAQGINFSLMNLYKLLAQNRISPWRAALLSYISSLLLRTLPQIDADRAAGITDPTKPSGKASDPDERLSTAQNSALDSVEEPYSNAETLPHPRSANACDPSSPEPDPRKKPS